MKKLSCYFFCAKAVWKVRVPFCSSFCFLACFLSPHLSNKRDSLYMHTASYPESKAGTKFLEQMSFLMFCCFSAIFSHFCGFSYQVPLHFIQGMVLFQHKPIIHFPLFLSCHQAGGNVTKMPILLGEQICKMQKQQKVETSQFLKTKSKAIMIQNPNQKYHVFLGEPKQILNNIQDMSTCLSMKSR